MATLAEAITELESGQTHQEMLVALRARTKVVNGIAQSGYVLAYLASIGKLGAIKAIAADETSPLRDAAEATMITLQTREGFDFSIPETAGLLNAYVAIGVLTEEQAAVILSMGATAEPEFKDITLRDVIAVREPALFTQTHSNVGAVNGAKNRNQLLIVSLGADLPEPVNLQYQVRNKFSGEWSEWEGSSIAGLTNKQSAGIYSARLPGEFIKSTEAEIRVVCQYNVPLTLSVEVA
jgi:hypothetical protein